jgi:PA domain
MKKSHSFRDSVRHSLLVLGLLGLVAAMLGIGSTASAAPASCEVDNSTSFATYSSLQAGIDAASPGDTLEVKGTCVGTSTVTKSLRINGVSKVSILDARDAGTTLTVNPSVSVTVNRLTIQGGSSLLNSHFVVGGGDVSWVNIGGAQLPPTSGTENYVLVGRACNGDTLSADPSGKVALIRRGTCVFSEKAANAAAAGATAAVIFNNQPLPGPFPQATRLVNPVAIPVVGISSAAGAAMGSSGTLTWTDWKQNGFYAQGCGGGGICNSGTLALVDSVVTGNRGTEGGGVFVKAGTLTLAGSTSFSSDVGTFGGGIGHPAGTVNAADGTSTYTDPISGASLPAWTGSFVDNFIGNCNPTISLGSFNCSQ